MPRIKKEDKQAQKIAQLEYDLKDSERTVARYAALLGGIRTLFPGAEERDLLKRIVDLIKEKSYNDGQIGTLANTINIVHRNLRVALKDETLIKEVEEDPIMRRFNN